jgi:hypothetical protein
MKSGVTAVNAGGAAAAAMLVPAGDDARENGLTEQRTGALAATAEPASLQVGKILNTVTWRRCRVAVRAPTRPFILGTRHPRDRVTNCTTYYTTAQLFWLEFVVPIALRPGAQEIPQSQHRLRKSLRATCHGPEHSNRDRTHDSLHGTLQQAHGTRFMQSSPPPSPGTHCAPPRGPLRPRAGTPASAPR